MTRITRDDHKEILWIRNNIARKPIRTVTNAPPASALGN